MKTALLVIDVQESFLCKETEKIPAKIKKLLENHQFDFIFFFKFKNKQDSNWVKLLKWRGMLKDKETAVAQELKSFLTKENVFVKQAAFSVFSVDKFNKTLSENDIEKLFLCGLDTHACVYVSAMQAFARGFDVKVIEDLCAASHGKKYHNAAIKLLRRNLGDKIVVNSKEGQGAE